jgi:hypothetical protein
MSPIHKLCSVHANLPKSLANEIIGWGMRNIPDAEVHEEPGRGREDEIHVTAFYGIIGDGLGPVRVVSRSYAPFTAELGPITLFSNPDYDVVKIEVASPDLHEIHSAIEHKVASITSTSSPRRYHPHVTIAYVKKGTGWPYEGDTAFEGRLFEVKTLLYSDRAGVKSAIPLTPAGGIARR